MTKELSKEERDNLICGICGAKCKKHEHCCDAEWAEYSASWGYDSKRDLLQMSIIICEDCSFLVEDFIKRLGGKFKYSEFSPKYVYEGRLVKFYEEKDRENYETI